MRRSITLFLLVLLGTAAPLSAAATHHLDEDFATWQLRDGAFTTADWDTLAGELKLPDFDFWNAGAATFSQGRARDVVIRGDVAYIASYQYGLVTVNVSDPTQPVFLGARSWGQYAYGIDVAGNYAYLADKDLGLIIFDITHPDAPTFLSQYNPAGYCYDVEVHGNLAYIAADTEGLRIRDVADPEHINIVYNTAGNARSVTVVGNHAFVGDGIGGLVILDVTNPALPILTAVVPEAYGARGCAVSGDLAAVACGAGEVMFYDITNPAAPVHRATVLTNSLVYDVQITGQLAVVADGTAGVTGIDISDLANPVVSYHVDTPGLAMRLAIDGDHAYAATDDGDLQVVGLQQRTVPAIVGSSSAVTNSRDVVVRGDLAFVADGWERGLRILNVNDPTNPVYLGGIGFSTSSGYAVAVDGDFAYLANNGLRVLNVSDPGAPTAVGYYVTAEAYDVVVEGDLAYLAAGADGLKIVNVEDPSSPSEVGDFDPGFSVKGVQVSGSYAYIVGMDLVAVNVSNPSSPTEEGRNALGGEDIAIAGDHLYMVSGGLHVFNITLPGTLEEIGSCDLASGARRITVCGEYAYIGFFAAQMQIVDISNPNLPVVVETVALPDNSWAIDVQGPYAYVADENDGLQVVQVGTRAGLSLFNNAARSLALDSSSETVVKMSLTPVSTDSFTWYVSADDGANWQTAAADGSWLDLTVPGTDPLWSATLTSPDGLSNPTCSDLAVDWLYTSAAPDSVVDVPGDQGGWARLHFTRSGYDFADVTINPITDYFVFRRLESETAAGANQPTSGGDAALALKNLPARLCGRPVVLNNGVPCVTVTAKSTGTMPPGVWEVVGAVPAHQQDQYICLVPTLADSAATLLATEYCVSAETTTPSVYYVSEVTSGYSVDNIAPGVPDKLSVAYAAGGNQLTWDPSPDLDFQYFRIYRGTSADFVPGPGNLVHNTSAVEWTDDAPDAWHHYYKVSAVDHAGNESAAATPAEISGAELPDVPTTVALRQNTPNPFNPLTTIRYELPDATWVDLRVYDVSGRLVRRLVDEIVPAGRHSVQWDGRDDSGRGSASGAYICRLEAEGLVAVRRLMLVR